MLFLLGISISIQYVRVLGTGVQVIPEMEYDPTAKYIKYNPYINCTASTCSLDGCDTDTFVTTINNLKSMAPQNKEPSVEEIKIGVKKFKECMNGFMLCSKAKSLSTDKNEFCSSFPRCSSVSGFYCAHAAQCIGNRVLFCAGKHFSMNTGHSFDFFAAPGGYAVPLSAGLEQNPSLMNVTAAPFYTSCEMNADHYNYFETNMMNRNYLLLRNDKCYNSGFDTSKFVKATAPTLEIMTQDANGLDVASFISSIVDYSSITEDFLNLRYQLIQVHPEGSKTVDLMNRLVEEKAWTRVWYSNAWYEWSEIYKEHRSDTYFAAYAKGYMPEFHVVP